MKLMMNTIAAIITLSLAGVYAAESLPIGESESGRSAEDERSIDSEHSHALFLCIREGTNSPELSRLILGNREDIPSYGQGKYFLRHGNYRYPNVDKNGNIFSGSNSFTPWARSVGFDVGTGRLYEMQASLDPSHRLIIEWKSQCIAADPEESR